MQQSSDPARGKSALIRSRPTGPRARLILVTLDNTLADRTATRRRRFFQMSALSTAMAGELPAMVATGNGESGFDSGEGA